MGLNGYYVHQNNTSRLSFGPYTIRICLECGKYKHKNVIKIIRRTIIIQGNEYCLGKCILYGV